MLNVHRIIGPQSHRTWLALLLAGLAGCAQFKAPQDEYRIGVGVIQPAGEAVSLLYYFDYARGLSAADLAKETERMRLLHVRNKSDFHALQYVMLLSIPGGDAHRAQQLLEPLTREGGAQSRELRALALLLTTDLAERRRLEDGVRKADVLEKKLEALKNIVKSLNVAERRRLEDGVRKADDLEKKLEALKNIEKNLIQRDIIEPGEKK